MINKKLLSFDRGALRYVGANVAFQWLGMLCNVIFVRAIARLVGEAFAGSLTSAQLWQNLVLCLATVPMRFAFTMLASAMSDQASKDVKRTLRSSIYAKLARLGPNYTETAATSEVVMLASEGVEQIDTYFAKYLPQLFYSLLAPVTLFVLLVGVHARSAIILLCCVPLIPMSIVAVQKFAKKLLANYWGEYTTLGDSFLENIQGLTTLKIYQADGWKHEQMNAQAERFRRITMKVLTMQLNSVTLMDLMAYGGAGLGIISAVAAFAAGRLTLTATLTIVLLAGYLLVGVALPVWSAKRGDRAAREYRQALADTNSYVLESLRGLKDTLQYQDTAARAEGITVHSEMLGEKQKAMKYREGLTVAITNTLILLTVLAVLGVSLNLYQSGKMGVEGVLVCTLSALSSFGPVVALANLGASLTQVFASADRVLDLLDEQPVTADVTDGTDTAFAGAAAEHVNFAYANEEVLHDLSLTVPEKKIVGITGRSGSGKSTFLRLLMRFWDVSSGSIRFGAEDIRHVNTAALREQESLVTQETELFDDTIENNIRIAKRDATREEVEAACKKAALDGFIHSLPKGYDTPVGELGGALSGGERQRIGVARAFLHDAPFLLLDEPTSNLDSLNEGVILKAVRAECKDKTVLLVSHRKSTMAAADISFSVESGRLS